MGSCLQLLWDTFSLGFSYYQVSQIVSYGARGGFSELVEALLHLPESTDQRSVCIRQKEDWQHLSQMILLPIYMLRSEGRE